MLRKLWLGEAQRGGGQRRFVDIHNIEKDLGACWDAWRQRCEKWELRWVDIELCLP